MTREDVIKAMECCQSNQIGGLGCDRCPNLHTEDCEGLLHHFALELLKAQEPVKPGLGKINHDDGSVSYFLHCPFDGVTLVDGDNYCRCCGRAVKWDG